MLCSLVFFLFKTPQVNLRAFKNKKSHFRGILFCREEGIRTLEGLHPTRFPGVRLKPLGHLSKTGG